MGIDVGSRILDYEIIAQLRLGGMATLFLAQRQGAAGFAKPVAIKVIHPHLARDPSFRAMFVDEANISAKIEHPNVVHVEQLGEVDGTLFLVMEYVHGVTLSQLLAALTKKGRRLSPAFAVHVAAKVAEGLHAAHETLGDDGHLLGVVHRDVSPQNILISSRGHVKLIDFGIAKARGRAQQTSTTSLKGKIRYMSPEQAYGRPVDRRTDVYALGVVLWEMLTMERAFKGDDDLAVLDRVRNPQIRPPSQVASQVAYAVDVAVMHALAPDAAARTPTGQEMRRELGAALPEALALDDGQLSTLIWELLRRELEEERGRIPHGSALAGSRDLPSAPAPAQATQAIELYTLSDSRIAAQRPEDAVAVVEATSPPAVSVAVPMSGGAPQFTPPPASDGRRSPVLGLALGAVALLAVGGAGGWAVLQVLRTTQEPSPAIVLPQAATQPLQVMPVQALPVAPPAPVDPAGVAGAVPPVVPGAVPLAVPSVAPDAGVAQVAATGARPGHHGHGHSTSTAATAHTQAGAADSAGGGGRPLATSFDE